MGRQIEVAVQLDDEVGDCPEPLEPQIEGANDRPTAGAVVTGPGVDCLDPVVPLGELLRELTRAVGRAVVDDHPAPRRQLLVGERAGQPGQVPCLVAHGCDHRVVHAGRLFQPGRTLPCGEAASRRTTTMATTTELTPPLADHRNGGHSTPPPLSPFQAVVAHPFLTLLPILLMVGGAIAFGLTREPTWTSEARLSVGELTPSTQSAPGIVEANQQLASAFSRAIDARRVVAPVSRELGLTSTEVQRLDATPIPESPVLTVSGTGPTERDAVAITRVGTSSLVRYIRRLGDTGPEERRLLGELTEARREVARLQETVVAEPNPELDAAQLRARALESEYLESTRNPRSTPVTELNPAEVGTSDWEKVLKLAIVVAALTGIAVGAALATVRRPGCANGSARLRRAHGANHHLGVAAHARGRHRGRPGCRRSARHGP